MSEHRTSAGKIYLLVHDPVCEVFHHSDLQKEYTPWAADDDTARPQRYEATPLTPDGYRTGPAIEILWFPAIGRAGLACGAEAEWTDAETPEDALERYLGIDEKSMQH